MPTAGPGQKVGVHETQESRQRVVLPRTFTCAMDGFHGKPWG